MKSKSSKRAVLFTRVSKQNMAFIKRAARKQNISIAEFVNTKITAIRTKKAAHA